MTKTSVFAPITKSAEQDDGTLYVYGKATGSDMDLDQQRCDPEWLSKAMPEWFRIGNVRSQHDPSQAVGKAVEHAELDDGHYIKAHIVDPIAVKKTKAGVFTGFSIGIGRPRVEKTADVPNGWIRDGSIYEVSLVDRPAYPTATFTMCKAAKPGMEIKSQDFDAKRLLVRCEELIEKADEPDSMTVKIGENLSDEVKQKLDSLTGEEVDEKAADPLVMTPTGPALMAALEKTKAGIDSLSDVDVKVGLDTGDTWGANLVNKMAGFNRDKALELVKAAADMPPDYDHEQVDIENAQEAISILSQLIISEASEMADCPAEDCDIQILLDAVAALRHFICREQQQAMGADVVKKPVPIFLGADPDLTKGKYSADQLRSMLKAGKAFRNPAGEPSYPIGDKQDLGNAIRAVGRGSGDHNAIRAYIKRRAKALGASNMIPDNWGSNGSKKAADMSDTTVDLQEGTDEVLEKAQQEDTDGDGGEAVILKDADADVTKAVTAEVDMDAVSKAVSDAIASAFSSDVLDKEDNPIRKTFKSIVEAAQETTAKSVTELMERLVKVEQMAVPGGPPLRRTEIERAQARKTDLTNEAMRLKALANSTEDQVLRKGYTAKVSQLEHEIKALA